MGRKILVSVGGWVGTIPGISVTTVAENEGTAEGALLGMELGAIDGLVLGAKEGAKDGEAEFTPSAGTARPKKLDARSCLASMGASTRHPTSSVTEKVPSLVHKKN